MKVLVCGGREFKDASRIREVLSAFHAAQPIARLIEGGATGADKLAFEWAKGHNVAVSKYRAKWHLHGKAAGPIRNELMLRAGQPDVVIAFPGGAGTAHMVKIAREAGVEVLVIKET